MNLSPENIIKRPIALTEKATRLKVEANQVVFEVALGANKLQIRDAVERLAKHILMRFFKLHMKGSSHGRHRPSVIPARGLCMVTSCNCPSGLVVFIQYG